MDGGEPSLIKGTVRANDGAIGNHLSFVLFSGAVSKNFCLMKMSMMLSYFVGFKTMCSSARALLVLTRPAPG